MLSEMPKGTGEREMMNRLRRHQQLRRSDERGSVLVIALVMVFLIAIIITAALSYSSTGLRASSTIASDSKTQAAGDGAMQAAVQYLLANPGDHCGINGSTAGLLLQLPGQNGQPASYVTCEAVKVDRTPGTGDQTSDAPQYAILTMGQRANMPSNQGNYSGSQWLGSGQTSEQGVFFQPVLTGYAALLGSCAGSQLTWSSFCYKQTGNVVIAGKVFSNSSIGVNNPTGSGTQSFSTSDATKYNFTVRQPCTVSAGAAMSPYPCSVVPYSDTTQGPDPGFTSRGQWAAGQGNLPARATVPACPAGTLVRFTPGWYASAKALNDLFKTCVNSDGTSKDFWFQPGVYYFDFQDTAAQWNPASSSQYCGIGVDYPQDTNLFQSSPSLGSAGNPGSGVSAATRQALEHQWCIRGGTASNGSPASSNDYRPHVISGALNSVFNPVAALMSATQAASADFVNPNNGLTINGTSSTYAWLSSNSVMVPLTAASADFNGFNNAKQIDGTLASLSLQSSNQAIALNTAASADFVNPNNGKAIDTSVSTLGLQGTSQAIVANTASGPDYTNPNNGKVIDNSVASLTLQNNNQTVEPTVAASTTFTNPNNGRTIDSSVSTLNIGGSVTQSAGTASSPDFTTPNNATGAPDGTVSSLAINGSTTSQTPATATGPAWTNANSGRAIDGSSATLGAGSTNTPQTTGAAATTQTAGVNDFGTTTNATGAPNSTLSSATLGNVYATTPGTAASSTVSGSSDFATTANATGTINGTQSTAAYTNSGTSNTTLAPASNFENSPSSGYSDFSNALNAQVISGGVMNTGNSANYSASLFTNPGEIRMIGYPDIAAGTALSTVTLTVRHQESSTGSGASVQVLVQDGSNNNNTLCTITVPAQTSTNPATPFVSVNLGPTASGGNNCLTTVNQINNVKFDYRVDASGFSAVNFLLDGMSLTVASTGDTNNRTLALSNFAPQLPNAASTTVDAATLSIAHKETANANPQLLLSGVNIAAGNPACNTINLTPSTAGATDAVNLLTQLATNCGIAAANIAATINGLTATYVTHLSTTGTATVNLDGINLALTATDTTSRTLTLSGITPAVSATAGNVIDSASLAFAHQEQVGGVGPAPIVSLVVTPGGGGSCSFPLTVRPALTTETINVTACLNTPAKLNGATYAYQVHLVDGGNVSQSVTASVDGLTTTLISTDTGNQTLGLSNPAPALTAGAVVDSSSLFFAHQEATGSVNPRLVLSGGSIVGTCNIPLTTRPALTTDQFNLYAQLTATCGIATANLVTTLNALTVTYTFNMAATAGDGTTQSATVAVDGLRVDTTTTNNATHTLTMSTPTPAVPGTATIGTVTLQIAHQETGNGSSPALTITPGGGGACAAIALTPRATLTTDTVTVPAGCLTTATGINGASYAYSVHQTGVFGDGVTQTSTTSVDGILVTITLNDTSTKTLTLSNTAPTVPNVAIETVTLQIAHQETGSGSNPTLTITPGGAAACTAIVLTPHATLTTDTVTVPANCLTTAARINGATYAYSVHIASGTASVAVDGVRLTVISGTDTTTHTLTLSAPTPAVPATTTIDTVTLQIAHQETGSNTSPTLVIDPGGAAACTAIALTPRAVLTTDTVTIPANCLNSATAINGATFAYSVHLTANGGGQSATVGEDGVLLTVTSTDLATHTLTLSAPTPAVPAGVTVDGVTLQISHQETGSNASPTLVITPGGAAACTPIALTPRATLSTDTVTVPAGCLNTPARINGATFAYQVHLTSTGAPQSASVAEDGIRMFVVSTDTATHTLALSNLSNPASTTAGNTVSSAVLSFAHQEVGSNMNPTLVITPGGAAACAAIPLTARATLTTDTLDVTSCLNTPAKLNGASIAYQVHFTDNGTALSGTASVDGAQIAATVVASGTRTLALSSFGPTLPTTATGWDSLIVNVAHAESAGTNPTLIVTPGGGAACNIPLAVHSTLATDSIVLDSTCPIKNTTVANGITVQYQVTGSTNATAALDGVSLNASYYKRPYTGTGSQGVVQSPAGACDNSITGAQWIFGGDSHIYVPDATMQLCAGPSPGHPGQVGYNAQQIAVYGVPPIPVVVPSSNVSTGWTTPTNAYQIGEYDDTTHASRLTADIAPASSAKTMTLSGFNATTVPNGMTVTNVTARVSHSEDGNLTAPKISFTNGAGTNCGTTTLPTFATTVRYSPVDVTSCFNTAAKLGGAGATVPVSALYTTGTTNSATNKEHLDGVALDVTYGWTDPNASVAPGFMPESGCITTYPNFDDGYNSPDCALMKWDSVESRIDVLAGLANFPYYDMCDGSAGHTSSEAQNGDPHCLPNAQVSFAGTLYAPGAGVAIDDQGYRSTTAVSQCALNTGFFDSHTGGNGSACYAGVNYAIFDRGVIARSVRFNSFKGNFTGAIIACGGSNGDPNDPACRGGQVTTGYEETLTAYVCPPGPAMQPGVPCTGPQQRVTAKVLIPNVAGATPQITQWNANQEP
jgi:hypothetical protein